MKYCVINKSRVLRLVPGLNESNWKAEDDHTEVFEPVELVSDEAAIALFERLKVDFARERAKDYLKYKLTLVKIVAE